MPALTKSIIYQNHSSLLEHMPGVMETINKEMDAGLISGPFSLPEIESICRGPVVMSPLIAVVQSEKVRICRNLSKGSVEMDSINSFVDKVDFPTLFGCASNVANIVSPFIIIIHPVDSQGVIPRNSCI